MRAVRFTRFGGPELLEIADLPVPDPGPRQIRVAVRAAAVSATDTKARRGLHDEGLPQTTGRDLAGIVDAVGAEVTDVAVGDAVFGLSDEGAAVAEFALATFYAPVPPILGLVDAAALPVALETATRGLDTLDLHAGDTLVVSGASGAIGSVAVQLAVARGVRVIGTAGSGNQDAVRALGAEPVVYGEGFANRVRALAPEGADRALDVAGAGVLPELVALTGSPDRVVTLADPVGAAAAGVRFSTGAVGRATHILGEIGALIEAGLFWLPVERTVPLSRIAEAHRLVEDPRIHGRVVVLID